MKAKKFISIALAAVLTLGILTGCSSSKTSGSSASSASSAGSDERVLFII